MAHKVILPPKKNYILQFLKQRDINSYYSQLRGILFEAELLVVDLNGERPALGWQFPTKILSRGRWKRRNIGCSGEIPEFRSEPFRRGEKCSEFCTMEQN
jgi:hypothetical protein